MANRDLKQMMDERDIDLAHTTIPDCVKTQKSGKTGDGKSLSEAEKFVTGQI
jgi:hypothetical protein